MFYFSTSKYESRKSILSQSGGCVMKNFPGGFAPRPPHFPAPPIDLLVYIIFKMVQHFTQIFPNYRIQVHDICRSFNICHSYSEWTIQGPSFYKSLPKTVFTKTDKKTDKNQTLYILDKLPFWKKRKIWLCPTPFWML